MNRPLVAHLSSFVAIMLLSSSAHSILLVEDDALHPETLVAPAGSTWWDAVGPHVLYGSTGSVYVGNGWFLTARHIGTHERAPRILGTDYPAVPGSYRDVGSGGWDIGMFRVLDPIPQVQPAVVSETEPVVGDTLYIVGYGRRQQFQLFDPDGWSYCCDSTLRWGTNVVEVEGGANRLIHLYWDQSVGGTEGMGAFGDSGGPVFNESNEIVGVVSSGCNGGDCFFEETGQGAALGVIDAADSVIRDDIISTLSMPACNDGLDDDGDGLIDLADPQCHDASDTSESPIVGVTVVTP